MKIAAIALQHVALREGKSFRGGSPKCLAGEMRHAFTADERTRISMLDGVVLVRIDGCPIMFPWHDVAYAVPSETNDSGDK